uniref:G-protein coupled receptors family 1 profile domain-containing protein n=1 Tax=Plectus sambesii TaxID=2011161 RepID=A0A914WFF0_9BILA
MLLIDHQLSGGLFFRISTLRLVVSRLCRLLITFLSLFIANNHRPPPSSTQSPPPPRLLPPHSKLSPTETNIAPSTHTFSPTSIEPVLRFVMVTVKDLLEHEAGLLELNDTTSGYSPPSWLPVLRSVFSWTLVLATAGVMINLFVLLKLIAIMQRHPMLNPAVTLFAMTASDIVCQLSLLLYAVTGQFVFDQSVPLPVQQVFCKTTITLIHMTSSFSTWCWVVLSSLRYLAICAPIVYNSHPCCQRPTVILAFILCVCVLVDSWMPMYITFDDTTAFDCAPYNFADVDTLRTFYSIEVLWTCFVPVIITVAMDLSLVLRRPGLLIKGNQTPNTSRFCLKPVSEINSARQRRGQRMLRRYLILASLDLIMNVPHSIIRFIAMHTHVEMGLGIELLSMIIYCLYYGQFNINIFYLWALCKPSEETRCRHDMPSTHETGALRDQFLGSLTTSPETDTNNYHDDVEMKIFMRPRATTFTC